MKLPAVAKRASWNLIDQMVSSLTNAVLSFMVARAVDPVTFGGFAVAFTIFALVIGGARALCTSPLNIRFSDAGPAEQHRAAAAGTGLSLLIAAVVGLGTAVAGLALGGSTGEALLAMGLVLPAVIVQDSYRYVFFSRQTPVKAAANDGAWAVLQIGAVAVLLFAGVSSVGPFVVVWGVAGLAAVLLALRQSATLPAPRQALAWLREQSNLTRYTFASWATQQGTMQGALLVIAAVATVAVNGALRGAQILLGPAAIISSSALTFAIPEFSRRRRTMTDRQWVLAAFGVSAVVAFLALCWGAVFLLMPDVVGLYLLTETWAGTRELLFAAVVGQVLSCLTVGPVVMLYAIDRAKATFRIHLVLGTLVFLGGVVGVLLAGGPGAQWGFAIANGLVLPFWFVLLWRELRARAADGPEPEEEAELTGGDAEATAVLAAYRRTPGHYFHDLESAQMATMVLPRIDLARARAAASARPAAPPPPAAPLPSPVPRPGPVPRGTVPRGPAGTVPPAPAAPGPTGRYPHSGRPGGPASARPPAPPDTGRDVAPHQDTRAHILPPPPPAPSPRPEQPAPADATATVIVPVPALPGSTTTGGERPGTPDRATASAESSSAASEPVDEATTVHQVVGPAASGHDAPKPDGWFDPHAARAAGRGGPAAARPRPTPRPRPAAPPGPPPAPSAPIRNGAARDGRTGSPVGDAGPAGGHGPERRGTAGGTSDEPTDAATTGGSTRGGTADDRAGSSGADRTRTASGGMPGGGTANRSTPPGGPTRAGSAAGRAPDAGRATERPADHDPAVSSASSDTVHRKAGAGGPTSPSRASVSATTTDGDGPDGHRSHDHRSDGPRPTGDRAAAEATARVVRVPGGRSSSG